MLDRKQLLIIRKLVEDQIIDKKLLQKSLHLTTRQIDYSLEKINSLLKLEKLNLINYDGAFISVPDDVLNYLVNLSNYDVDPDKYVFDKDERQDLLFLILANGGYVGIKDLNTVLDVSSSTMHKDLKELKEKIANEELILKYKIGKGYQIIGEEDTIRYTLANIIVKRTSTDNYSILKWFFYVVQGQNLKQYINYISDEAEKYKLSFVEDHKLQFIYTYIAELTRIHEFPNYKPPRLIDCSQINKTQEWKLARELLSKEKITNKASISYVTTLLLCTTIGGDTKLDLDNKVHELARKFVNEFVSISGINFYNLSEIENQIFTHFRSMYFREIFKFPVNNPLTDQIKENYDEVFTLVSKALFVIKDEVGVLPDSEVAFLTIHLMNFIYTKNSQRTKKPKAAIFCQNGIATSTLLYLQLINIFPEIEFLPPFKYSELEEKVENVDIIFATFYKARLFTFGKPCFIVNPILNTSEKEMLIQKVRSLLNKPNSLSVSSVLNVVSKYVTDNKTLDKIRGDLIKNLNPSKKQKNINNKKKIGLLNVTDYNTIQLNVSADNVFDVIKIAAEPLIKQKKVTEEYIKSMQETNLNGNFDNFIIAPQIALPHSKPENGVNGLGLSITSLKEPCEFGTKFGGNVKYIFTLSAVDNVSHLGILKDLMKLVTDSNFFRQLDKGNKEEVMIYLENKLNGSDF